MKLTEKEAALEAILFTMGEAVETKRLAEAIGETPEKTRELLEKLRAGWEKEHRGVNLISLEDSWQMCTRSEFYDYLIRIAKASISAAIVSATLPSPIRSSRKTPCPA